MSPLALLFPTLSHIYSTILNAQIITLSNMLQIPPSSGDFGGLIPPNLPPQNCVLKLYNCNLLTTFNQAWLPLKLCQFHPIPVTFCNIVVPRSIAQFCPLFSESVSKRSVLILNNGFCQIARHI